MTRALQSNRGVDIGLGLLLLSLVVAAVFFARAYEQRAEAAATRHLTTMLMLRESVLQSYLESLRSEVTLWSSQPIVRDILSLLNAAQRESGTDAVDQIGRLDTGEFENAATGRGTIWGGVGKDQEID